MVDVLNLAPDPQEEILFMPPVARGPDPPKEWQVRPVAAEPLWGTGAAEVRAPRV